MTPPFDLPRRTRLRKRAGRCYELSGDAALRHPDWRLVHGIVDMASGDRMGHAWVERDGWVYDAVLDRSMRSVEYRERFNAVEVGSWSGGSSVAEQLLRHSHWGPWAELGGQDGGAAAPRRSAPQELGPLADDTSAAPSPP